MKIESVSTDKSPAAVGPYSQAVKYGNFLFASGMLPIDMATGELELTSIEKATENIFNNFKALLETQGLSLKNVVKTTVFMTDLSEFTKMNDVYAKYFENPLPARSTVQVAALPKGVKIEIELIAAATE